jgi:2-succinyl-5-enolpyruvyl-6-hydroxy-3-cyclohexene-1-carboxylate synthase
MRLAYCKSDVRPDPAFFEEEKLVTPTISSSLSAAQKHSEWTSYVDVWTCTVPSTKKGRKTPAWSLEAAFFVVVGHDKAASRNEIAKYVKTVVCPTIAARFMGLFESMATLAGIPVRPLAAVGWDFDWDDLNIVEEITDET